MGLFIQSCFGEGGTLQTNTLACAHSDSATLGLSPLTVCVLFQSAQTLGCSSGNCLMQALACMHFPGLSCSGSGSQIFHKGEDLVGPAFGSCPRSEQLR